MGVEPFLLASAMKMVISQRLWKRMCSACKEPFPLKEWEIKKVREHLWPIIDEDVENLTFYKWAGCDKCKGTWYKWRLWIHEVLICGDYLEPLILEKESANNMKEAAIKEWMVTIVQDGLLKALLWETTVEEALKLI
jgi:type IV pilus assembly protein PilB